MRRSKRHYDEWADRLAAGDCDLGDEDAVSAFTGMLQADSADEPVDSRLPATLAAEALQVAENAPVRTTGGRDARPLTMRWRRRAMISTFLSTLFGKIAVGSVAVAVAATGAAATGNLPDVAQQRVADSLAGIGIDIPAPDRGPDGAGDEALSEFEGSVETTAPVLPDEASDKAKGVTDTVFEGDPADGRDFGEAVSGTASDGAASGAPEAPAVPDRPEQPVAPEQPVTPEQPVAPPTSELPGDADEGLDRRP